ncbi:MAG: lytic transglycosylase domain-containing protein [Bdellovibrionaceae bacterium]|nr:lytic transglycosylase domain-containing protein [Pseudobdellovibrionaceae bacterium]
MFEGDPIKEDPVTEPTPPDEEKVGTLEEDTPLAQTEVRGGKSLTGTRRYREPDFSGQDKALGYGPNAFNVPKGMEKQVAFWKDIYAKYSTDQGILHDIENLDIVYGEVDFRPINADPDLTFRQKEKKKQKLVDEKKNEIREILLKLDKVQSSDGLNEFDKKIWNLFQNVNEPDKFKDAAEKHRVRFQLGQKDRMQSAIFFSGRYLEDMEKIFRDAGLPIELTRLVFVESSFNVLARSKVGASGLWQIMRYTARPYKMVTSAVDLRNHPISATKLAAKLLRDNYNLLKDWPLALTGYNHGPTGVRKLTEKYKTRNIADLIQNVTSRKSFGFASRNFYACFLAVHEVEMNATKYFPRATWSQPLDQEEIKLPIAVKYKDLQTWFDGNDEKTQVFNPHINRGRRLTTTIPAKTLVAIPKELYSQALTALARGVFKYSPDSVPQLKSADTPSGPEIKAATPADTEQ